MKLLSISLLLIALPLAAHASDMKLTIAGLKNGDTMPDAQVFNSFGCTGQNISPALSWSGIPAGTKSLALTVYDPDAPTGSGWWHWVVFNLPPDTTQLPANASAEQKIPAGAVESMTDYGKPGYGGACPPAGDKAHRYIFTLFALKAESLPLDSKSPAAMVGYYLHQNTLAKASVTLRYGRK